MDALILVLLLVVGAMVLWVWSQTSARLNSLSERLAQSGEAQKGTAAAFGHIQKTLGELSKAGEQMQRLGEEISGLSDLLEGPKFRCWTGELFLTAFLGQMQST